MVNKKLVLIGGGGHCKSVLDVVIRAEEYSDIVITDPDIKAGTTIFGFPVVGNDAILQRLFKDGYHHAFISLGSLGFPELRKQLTSMVEKIGFEFAIVIDPSATISRSVVVGAGSFIGKNVTVNADCQIGNHCIINTGSIIDHECKIGDFTHVSVGSILCGNVVVGMNAFIGTGSTLIQGINIGNGVVVGANSTVLGNVEENMKVYGVVKRQMGV